MATSSLCAHLVAFPVTRTWPLLYHLSLAGVPRPSENVDFSALHVLLQSSYPVGGHLHFPPSRLVLLVACLSPYCPSASTFLSSLVDLVARPWPFRFQTIGFLWCRVRCAELSIASKSCMSSEAYKASYSYLLHYNGFGHILPTAMTVTSANMALVPGSAYENLGDKYDHSLGHNSMAVRSTDLSSSVTEFVRYADQYLDARRLAEIPNYSRDKKKPQEDFW